MGSGKLSASCECTPVVEVQFGEKHEQSPSMAIVEAVAAAVGVAPEELDPLGEDIDLEAVDTLFPDQDETSTPPKFLSFSTAGWNVFVRGDGLIRICDPGRTTAVAPVFEKSVAD